MVNEEKYKHLTDESRMEIQSGLYAGCTFKQIARRIGKDPTTISKEVKSTSKYDRQKMSRTQHLVRHC